MLACTDCEPNIFLDSPPNYINHLKQHHYARSSGRFQCPLCFVTYSRMIRFEKHLSKCFTDQEKLPTSFQQNLDIERTNILVNTGTQQKLFSFNDIEAVCVEESSTTSSNIDLEAEESLEEVLEKIALEFALSLHSQPNLTRKDVFKIQDFVTNNIFTKLSEYLLKKTSKCSCPVNTEMVRSLKSVVKMFDNVKTEHLLNNKLERLALLKPPKEFVISRDVGVAFENRRAVFEIQATTGTLLELAFQVSEFVKRNRRVEEMVSNLEKYSNQTDGISHFVQVNSFFCRR